MFGIGLIVTLLVMVGIGFAIGYAVRGRVGKLKNLP
jgi:hypothetical protein